MKYNLNAIERHLPLSEKMKIKLAAYRAFLVSQRDLNAKRVTQIDKMLKA